MDGSCQYKHYPHYHYRLIKVPPPSGSLPRFSSWRAALLLCDLTVQGLSLPRDPSFSFLEDFSICAFSILWQMIYLETEIMSHLLFFAHKRTGCTVGAQGTFGEKSPRILKSELYQPLGPPES